MTAAVKEGEHISAGEAAKIDRLKNEFLALGVELGLKSVETYWKQGKLVAQLRPHFAGDGRPKKDDKRVKWEQFCVNDLLISIHQANYLNHVGSLLSLPTQENLEAAFQVISRLRAATIEKNHIGRLQALAGIATIAKEKKKTPNEAAQLFCIKQQKLLEDFLKTDRARHRKVDEYERNPPRGLSDEQIRRAGERAAEEIRRNKGGATPSRSSTGMSREEAFAEIGITGHSIEVSEETLGIIFRGLKQKRHPDKGGSNAAFVRLTKAMEILK